MVTPVMRCEGGSQFARIDAAEPAGEERLEQLACLPVRFGVRRGVARVRGARGGARGLRPRPSSALGSGCLRGVSRQGSAAGARGSARRRTRMGCASVKSSAAPAVSARANDGDCRHRQVVQQAAEGVGCISGRQARQHRHDHAVLEARLSISAGQLPDNPRRRHEPVRTASPAPFSIVACTASGRSQ